MDFGKNFFIGAVVEHWDELLKAVVESSLLEVLKRCVDEALRDMVCNRTWQIRLMVGLGDLGLPQPI